MQHVPASADPCLLLACRAQYDNRASDLTRDGMLNGIKHSFAFVLFLSVGVLERPYCQMEVRTALELGKPMVLIHGEKRISLASRMDHSFDGCSLKRATHATGDTTSAPPARPRHATFRSW